MRHLPLILLVCLSTLGAWLFPSGPAAAQGYRIQPGDVLQIEVLEDSSLNRQALVLPDGRFSFPFAGTLQASGRTVEQVEASLTQGIASNFAAPPNVFVSVQTLAERDAALPLGPPLAETVDIYFLGEVSNPGLRPVEEGTTLLQALSQGGAFTNFAALRRIQLRRTDPHTGRQSIVTFDYHAVSRGAAMSTDPVLIDGDVIIVPERRLFE